MATPFWLNDPTVLFKRDDLTYMWPSASMSSNEKLNAMTRLVLLLTVLGYLVSQNLRIIFTGGLTLAAIIILRYAQKGQESNSKEGFINPAIYPIDSQAFVKPLPNNPAMNVLLPQISDDPKRGPAAPAYNPQITKQMNEATQAFVKSNFNDPKIDEKLFKDLGDSFTFDQSMRTWYATPNTQIPNDQKAFAEYCYGDMISCKEGNELACSRSMPPHWINGQN